MDKKYAGKAVVLPKDVHAELEVVRQELAARLGFTPSLSETIAYLVRHRPAGV